MGSCYFMSRERALEIAEELRRIHPKLGDIIDHELVRIYCTDDVDTDLETAATAPGTPTWMDTAPAAEVAAWIDVQKLLDTGLAEGPSATV